MSDDLFLSSVQKLSSGALPIGELIGVAEAFKAAGRLDLVNQIYPLWIRTNENDPFRHIADFNYAVILSDAGDLPGARRHLESSLKQNPDFAPAYINLGGVSERQGHAYGAIKDWTELVNRLPQITGQAINYKLTALKQIGRVLETNLIAPQAEAVLKQSLEINPKQQDVLQHFVALRLAQCEWPVIQPWDGATTHSLMKGVGPLSMAILTDDPMMQLASGWNYCTNVLTYPYADLSAAHKAKRGETKNKLRVGYISSDLRNHAVGFIMAEVFDLHDREKFEVFAYYCGIPQEDALQTRIRVTIDHWIDIREMSDEQAAQRILDDGIDILVDVNGYTKDARTRVFAARPAPVIVNWLGFPSSMGSPYHHYIIADDFIIPEENEKYFTEKVLRLPCYQPNDRKRIISAHRPSRTEVGLPEKGFVFCCFNGAQKISSFVFDRWMTILSRVPGSVLWLLEGVDSSSQRLRDAAVARGVDPSRLVFAGKMMNPDHLARYPLADLFLDTASYGAHVTASDSLWMGVPILTVPGRGFAARVCASLTRAAGMEEMICGSIEDYVERAVALGNDPAEVARLKEKLAANRDDCLLFDTSGLVRHLEELYEEMWSDFVADRLPKPNLTNLDIYLDIGSGLPHETAEMLAVTDYPQLYRRELARRHRYHPLAADVRLWTEDDIARADDYLSS